MDKSYTNIDFEDFPPILGNSINLPENTLFYKSYDTKYNALSNRPSFFGSIESSSEYLSLENRKLGFFKSKCQMTLLDIRYIKNILNEMIINRVSNDVDIINNYMNIVLSFGFISLYEQLKLYKIRYKDGILDDKRYKKIVEFYNDSQKSNIYNKDLNINPLETEGIRIGETNNDLFSILILKKIFENSFDGIICPKFISPYHFESNFTIHGEIFLFNPKKFLKILKNPIKQKYIIKKNIVEILHENNIFPIATSFKMRNNSNLFYFHVGGNYEINLKNNNKKAENIDSLRYIDEKNDLIDKIYSKKANKNILEKIDLGGSKFKELLNIDFYRAGKETKNNKIENFQGYKPTVKISPWI